jgi:hypothetical protein
LTSLSRRDGFLFLVCLSAISCRTPKTTLNDHAREYVRLAVALGERDPDSLDSYSGPPEWVADVRAHPPSLHEISEAAANVAERVEQNASSHVTSIGRALLAFDDVDRPRLLVQSARAIEARANLLTGKRSPYDVESRALFGRVPSQLDQGRFEALRSAADRLLGGTGPLAERYAQFEKGLAIPPDRLSAVMAAAVAECRRRTLVEIKGFPLDQEGVSLEYVRNKPWSAYSRYLGRKRSTVSINMDFRFTVDQALQTACHETYPGHHTRSLLLDMEYALGRRWPEFTVQLLFSPQSFASEGTAMNAVDIAFREEDRVHYERVSLYPLAGMSGDDAERDVRLSKIVGELQDQQADIARRYLDGSLEFVRAGTALEEQALVAHPEGTLKYINQFRSYVTAYTAGRCDVSDSVRLCSGASDDVETRWRCFERLLTSPVIP